MSTMKSKRRPEPGADPEGPQEPPQEVVDRLAGLLPEGAREDAVKGLGPDELSGPGGLLSQLAGRVVEAALEAELTVSGPPQFGPVELRGARFRGDRVDGSSLNLTAGTHSVRAG